MKLTRIRTLLGCAAVLGGVLAPVAFAGPADAATVCGGRSNINHGSLTFTMPTTSANSGNVNCSLENGNISDGVRILQINLNDCYWSGSTTRGHAPAFSTRLAEDGQFGSRTEAALLAAQRTISGIGHDGEYGPETRSHINFFADDGLVGRCAKFGA